MSSYKQNYGFTKTLINDKNNNNNNININENGKEEFVSITLNNRDLMEIQPVEIPLEERLMNDFLSSPNIHKINNYHRNYKALKPITLEFGLIKRKSIKKRHRKKRKTQKKEKNT